MNAQDLHILLVDDELSVRLPLADLLKNRYFYNVDTAATGKEALDSVHHASKPYHVVIIDDRLTPDTGLAPRPYGIELMVKIREHSPSTEAIIITGWGTAAAIDALRAGAVYFIPKPVDPELLANLVLYAAEYRQIKGQVREKQILEQLMEVSAALPSGLGSGAVFARALHGIKKIGFDRVRLYLLDDKCSKLVGKAHLGMKDDFIGISWPVEEDRYMQTLIQEKRPCLFRREDKQPLPFEELLEKRGVDEWACVPIVTSQGKVIGKISADNLFSKQPIIEEQLNPIAVFASQVASAIENAKLFDIIKRHEHQLSILHKISDYVQAAGNLEKILRVVLTGITAGYGLGFNRAALFLLDEERKLLKGQMGIGFLKKKEAENDWRKHHKKGLEDFDTFLRNLEQESLPETPVYQRIKTQALPMEADNYLTQAVKEKKIQVLGEEEIRLLPKNFIWAFQPALPLVVVPLLSRGQAIGVLVVDNKFTGVPITQDSLEALVTFANSAAVAIENHHLYQTAKNAREKVESSFEASSSLVSSLSPESMLKEIIEQLQRTAGATWVSIILWDGMKLTTFLTTDKNNPDGTTIQDIVRPNGYTMQVLRTGKAIVIPNTFTQHPPVNMVMRTDKPEAAVCLPMSLQGKMIGVTWVHYDHPREFPAFEIIALQYYANQAAIAFDSTRRISEARQMREAIDKLSETSDLHDLLVMTLEQARNLFQADSTALRLYDPNQDSFMPDKAFAIGIPDPMWKELCRAGSDRDFLIPLIRERGWIAFTDIREEKNLKGLGWPTLNLLDQSGIRSTQLVALTVAGEVLAILYLNFNSPRVFTGEMEEMVRSFANQAALALKKLRLLELFREAHKAVSVVAEATALSEVRKSLDSIVSAIKSVLGCDIVTLYQYIEDEERFDHPPVMIGVYFPDEALDIDLVRKEPLMDAILAMDAPYVAEDALQDEFLRGPFTIREQVKSVVATPLKTDGHQEGIMFVNYRSPHRFDETELFNIRLFARQAAIALRNARLDKAVREQVDILNALYESGKSFTGTQNLDEMLSEVAIQALNIIGCNYEADGEREHIFSHIALLKERKLTFVASSSEHVLAKLKQDIREIDLESGSQIGIAGRAVLSGVTQNIPDITLDEQFISLDTATHSQLSVLLNANQKVIGVLTIEHTQRNAFTTSDVKNVVLLAAQAALAIDNIQRYDELKQTYEELKLTKRKVSGRTSLALMGMVTNHWRHAIEGDAITIKDQVALLRQALAKDLYREIPPSISEKLDKIARLARQIQEKPVTPPLSSEEGVSFFPLRELVSERMRQLWANENYRHCQYELKLEKEADTMVRASHEWVRRALDIIIDNAVDELENVPPERRKIIVTVCRVGNCVQVSVADLGRGIPEEIQKQLFVKNIEKNGDPKGMGMGLLMAQAIVETYGGTIFLNDNQPYGTVMIVQLPHKQP